VLRSKIPDGVIQEVYGYLCVHYAIRWLMHSAATDYGHDPDRLSFIRSLRAARRTTASHPGFSPEAITNAQTCVTAEILYELLPARRPAPILASSNAKCRATSSNTLITATRQRSTATPSLALK